MKKTSDYEAIERAYIGAIVHFDTKPIDPDLFQNPVYKRFARVAYNLDKEGKDWRYGQPYWSIDGHTEISNLLQFECIVADYFLESLIERHQTKLLSRMLNTAQTAIKHKNHADIDELIESLTAIQEYSGQETTEKPFLMDIKALWSRDKEDLGHAFEGFPELTKCSENLQQGLYLIGAQTNQGKTAFLSALALSLLDKAPVLVFSLDDTKEDFLARMIAQKTGIAINTVKAHSKASDTDKARIENAFNALNESFEIGNFRLYDIDETPDIKKIREKIHKALRDIHKDSSKPRCVVCIDGLHNLDTQENSENQRTANIARANVIKTLADTLNISVLTTLELRKLDQKHSENKAPSLHDIMESSKYAYNANVVLLLHEKDGVLNVNFGKNKRSGFKGNLSFEFSENKAQLKEIGVDTETVKTTKKQIINPLGKKA